jgi:hypothetical protein
MNERPHAIEPDRQLPSACAALLTKNGHLGKHRNLRVFTASVRAFSWSSSCACQ